jgi:hypothetical protein
MKNRNICRFACALVMAVFFMASGALSAHARDFHKSPRNFFFGNHIDTHQETKLDLTKNGAPEHLSGFFYIIYTGDIDAASGLPIARHPRGPAEGEDCNDKATGCVAGWQIDGLPGEAKFLYHTGVNGGDHPVWLVNRHDIAQPGSFTHFHWINQDSTDPRSGTVPDECDADNASELVNSAENVNCQGWFLEIKAIRAFAFEHGGETVLVTPGTDNATHLNLVTNYDEVPGITPTR